MPNPRLQEWTEPPWAKSRSRTVTLCPARTDRFWPQLAAVSNLLEEDGKTTKSINKLRKRSAQQDHPPKKKNPKKPKTGQLVIVVAQLSQSLQCARALSASSTDLGLF